VRQLLQSPSYTVFASCRTPANASALHALSSSKESTGKLHVLQLDVTSEESIKSAAAEVEAALQGNGLDYLINNAGMSPDRETILNIKPADFVYTFKVNVLGPALVLQHFVPLLDRAADPIVVNLSSGMGSIGLDLGPSAASYSVSKSALNMLTYKLSKEKPNIISLAMSPGHVKTDMGGSHAVLEPKESIAGMLKVIHGLKPEDSGTFRAYDGTARPW